jgi:hypothetical protein
MSQMKLKFSSMAVALSMLMMASIAGPANAATAPAVSPADLQTMFDQGLYPQMLSKLNVALAATPDSDKETRYKLLMLKGEGLLRTKGFDAAGDAFKAAGLMGLDDHSIAMARANAALIKHSTAGKYQPKTKTTAASAALPPAIDIIEPGTRKFAFSACFTDLMVTAKPQVDKAEKMTTLPPIMEVATQLADIRPLEIAGNGSDNDSKALLKKVGDHASTLMNTALKALDSQVATVSKQAAARKAKERTSSKNLSEVLLPEDVSNLDNIASQAGEVGTSAASMQTTFGDADTFKSVETAAQKTVDDVNKLLKQYKHPAAS